MDYERKRQFQRGIDEFMQHDAGYGSTTGAAATAGGNAASEGATMTLTAILQDAFNVLNGWLHVPTPPETMINPAGTLTGIGLQFPVVPATLTSWSFGCNYRET